MLYDCKRISCWIDRRLTGLAGPEYHAIISFGPPFESEDCQYGKSQLNALTIAQRSPSFQGFLEAVTNGGMAVDASAVRNP